MIKSKSIIHHIHGTFPGAERILERKVDRRARKQIEKFLDLDWYQRISKPFRNVAEASWHYMARGSSQCLAPNADMSDASGRILAPWAVEMMLHLGVPIGALPGNPTSADAPLLRRPFSLSRSTPKKRIAVVSAVFGGFDRILPVNPRWRETADFYLFTDHHYPDLIGWTPVRPNYFNEDPRRMSRFYKMHLPLYCRDYDWVIWQDGNILLCVSPEEVIAGVEDPRWSFASFAHPLRSNVISESAACAMAGREDVRLLLRQLSTYADEAAARKFPLFETNVMVLAPSDAMVRQLMALWWRELLAASFRDQVSLSVAISRTPGLQWGLLEGNAREGRQFLMSPHARASKRPHQQNAEIRALSLETEPARAAANLSSAERSPTADAGAALSVDIVVCVHNSPKDVRLCLDSLVPCLRADRRLIIVDDGSDAPAAEICDAIVAANPYTTRLIRRAQAGGFCRAANSGMRETTADLVIVLNSDTIVHGDWMDRLAACAARRPDIGVVGPLSNAASWQSIPRINTADGSMAVNEIADIATHLPAIHAACARFAAHVDPPVTELINGFCFGVARTLIDTIGFFDEELFPQGYGEENDYCFRAVDAGFVCAVAVDCFVYHGKSKSYGNERRKTLSAAGTKALIQRYGKPRIDRAVRSMQADPVLRMIRKEAEKLFAEQGWLRHGS